MVRSFVGSDGKSVELDSEVDDEPEAKVLAAWGAERLPATRSGEVVFKLQPGADAATFERAMGWAMPDGTAADSQFVLGLDDRMTVTMIPD